MYEYINVLYQYFFLKLGCSPRGQGFAGQGVEQVSDHQIRNQKGRTGLLRNKLSN